MLLLCFLSGLSESEWKTEAYAGLCGGQQKKMGGIASEKIAFSDNIQLSHVSGEHKISLRLFPVARIRESKESFVS